MDVELCDILIISMFHIWEKKKIRTCKAIENVVPLKSNNNRDSTCYFFETKPHHEVVSGFGKCQSYLETEQNKKEFIVLKWLNVKFWFSIILP